MTACPKMIGSETFIIVALRWSEKSTPWALASAICSARNVEQRPLAHDGGVDDLAGEERDRLLQHGGGAVRGDQLDARDRGLADGGGPLVGAEVAGVIVATWVFESGDQAPIECGWLRAYCFTEAGARRSELPSRSTGLTALPLIWS